MKKDNKAGKYGSGLLNQAASGINTQKQRKQSKLDSIMGDLQKNRGQRRRDNQGSR